MSRRAAAAAAAALAACAAALGLAHERAPAASTADGFQTASRNIACAASVNYLRCDIGGGVRPLPPRPRGCTVDFGQGVGMGRRGRASVICAGDTMLGSGDPVLAYGRTWRRGAFTCTSRRAGLTCRNLGGHGFFMSRERTRLF